VHSSFVWCRHPSLMPRKSDNQRSRDGGSERGDQADNEVGTQTDHAGYTA